MVVSVADVAYSILEYMIVFIILYLNPIFQILMIITRVQCP